MNLHFVQAVPCEIKIPATFHVLMPLALIQTTENLQLSICRDLDEESGLIGQLIQLLLL